jgi:hypothetical protein
MRHFRGLRFFIVLLSPPSTDAAKNYHTETTNQSITSCDSIVKLLKALRVSLAATQARFWRPFRLTSPLSQRG